MSSRNSHELADSPNSEATSTTGGYARNATTT
jgi:hypothetical protein